MPHASIQFTSNLIHDPMLMRSTCKAKRRMYDMMRHDVPVDCGSNLVASPWLDRMPFERHYSSFVGEEQEAW